MPAPAPDYPFPTELPYSPAELARLFGVVTVEQDPDPALHFKVMLPLRWAQVSGVRQLVTPAQPFALRSHFQALTFPAAEVKIFIAYVKEEISPRDWLALYLESRGEKIVREQYTEQAGGAQPDVLTVTDPAGEPRVCRWVVLKNWARIGGCHLFVLQVSTQAADYGPEMARIFFMAVSQFDLLHPTEWPYAERLHTLMRTRPTRLYTAFPLSWRQQPNPASDARFYQVKLTRQVRGRKIGLVNLLVLAGQQEADLRRLEEGVREGYAAEKLAFAPAEFAPVPGFNSFEQAYSALTPQTNAAAGAPTQERQVLLARTGTYWVYLENVRFVREAAPQEWAVSKRAFEIVQAHLAIGP